MRDFLREAVFFLITPTFAALSSAFESRGKRSFASAIFFWEIKTFACLNRFLIVLFTVRLPAFLLMLCRSAFFADAVIGI